MFGDHGADRRPSRGLVIGLGQAGALADHLAQRPEGQALAIGGTPPVVEPEVLRLGINMVQELPSETALADARRANDRHKASPLLAGGCVIEVLQERQLLVAADEGRLGAFAPPPAPDAAHDSNGAPGGNRALLPFRACSPAGSNTMPAAAARWVASPTRTVPGRHALEPRGRVHEVAGDHALVGGADA